MADLKLTADFTDLQTLKRELLDIPKKARDSARTFETEFARAERILVKQARQFQKNAQESQKFYSELLKLNSATKDAERSAQVFVRELEKEERAAAKAKTNYERLRATFDSSYAARMRLRQASQTLRAAVDAEIISVQEAAAMLRQYNAAANSSSVAATDLARSMNRKGVITQQAGYQLGDFIVQVQSGTNWMVAFGQQATQVAGTLTLLGGKWILIGSVLGVAIPLITAAGAAFMRTRNQAEEATESYEGLAQTLTKLEQIRLNSVGKSLADGAKGAIKEWENLLALMERVELRSLENELKKEFDNIIDQLSAFQNRLDVAARLGNAAPEFTLFDLKNMEEGIRLAQIVRGIQGESRQELQEQLRIAEERLRNEGLLTDATEELINNLANALGLTESLSDKTNEAADAAERFANNLVLGQEYLANAVRAGVASGAIPPQALNNLPQTAAEKAYQDLMERRRKEYYANAELLRKQDSERIALVREEREILRDQIALTQEALRYGEDSVQYRRLEVEQTLRAYAADLRRKNVGPEAIASLVEQYRLSLELSDQLDNSKDSASGLADALRDAASAMSALTDFSAGLDRALAVAAAKVGALREGANAAVAGQIAGMRVDLERLMNEAIGAGVDRGIIERMFGGERGRISQLSALEERVSLQEGQRRRGGGGRDKETVNDYLAGLEREAETRKRLLTLSDDAQRVEERRSKILEALRDKQGEVTEATRKRIEALIKSEEAVRKAMEAEERREQLMNSIQGHLEAGFMAMIDGSKSVEDAFKSMIRAILVDIAKQKIIEPIASGITGFLFGRASGGSVMAGQPYLVGEHGPELVIPGRSGTVMNADLTNKAMGGGQAVVINQTFQFSANGDDSVKRIIAAEAPKIAALTQKQIVDQRRRGGQMRSVFG